MAEPTTKELLARFPQYREVWEKCKDSKSRRYIRMGMLIRLKRGEVC